MNISRVKFTIIVDKAILDEAKVAAEQKNISLSRYIENFLRIMVNSYVYYFKYGLHFESSKAEICVKFIWIKCPKVGACDCGLPEETDAAVFCIKQVYENLLVGKVKNEARIIIQ